MKQILRFKNRSTLLFEEIMKQLEINPHSKILVDSALNLIEWVKSANSNHKMLEEGLLNDIIRKKGYTFLESWKSVNLELKGGLFRQELYLYWYYITFF